MALPSIMRKLFRNDGYGPLLKPEIIPFASGLASNAADAAASTKWVKDLAVAPIYVNPAGNDSNDGMSASSAVKTFARAVSIAETFSQKRIHIIAAGGTYTGDFSYANGGTIQIDITGNVTISGKISVSFSSAVLVRGSSYTFTVTSNTSGPVIYLGSNSILDLRCTKCIFQASGSASRVISIYSSYFYSTSDIELAVISSNTVQKVLEIFDLSFVNVDGEIAVDQGSYATAVQIDRLSALLCSELSVDHTSSFGSGPAVSVNQKSYLYVLNSTEVRSSTTASINVLINGMSYLICGGTVRFRINNQNAVNIRAQFFSHLFFGGTSLQFDCSTKCVSAIVLETASARIISSQLQSAGIYTKSFLDCSFNSVFSLDSSTLINNNSSGPRYFGYFNSSIYVAGRGDILPGNSAGTLSTNAVYG